MKVYKYPLYYTTVAEEVELPKGAKIIQAGVQMNNNPKLVFWAIVDETETEKEKRLFTLQFTGQPIDGEIVDTFNTLVIEETGIVVTLLEVKNPSRSFNPKEDNRFKEVNRNV